VTNQAKYWQFLTQAKSYGEKVKNRSEFISGHSRLPEIQAAILNVYLGDFAVSQKQRQKLADYFCAQINKNQLEPFITPLYEPASKMKFMAPHLFVIRALQRE